jgi:N-acetylglucosamine kinase-like BadF-type ATPase
MTSSAAVFVGLDGGGTKTCCVAVDANRVVLARVVTGASNANSVGDAAAASAVVQAIEGVLAAANRQLGDVAAICLCMSGVDRPADRLKVLRWLADGLPQLSGAQSPLVYVYNDAVGALAAGTGGRLHGIALISGTGTICVGVNEREEQIRASGWGPVLGDEGAGTSIAARALHAITLAVDGVTRPTLMTELVLAQLGLAQPSDLIAWAYAPETRGNWEKFAALTRCVVAAADAGDATAAAILHHAAFYLANSCLAVARRLYRSEHPDAPPPPELPALRDAASIAGNACRESAASEVHNLAAVHDVAVLRAARYDIVLVGGNVVAVDGVLRKRLLQLLHDALPLCTVHISDTEPALGAALVALNKSNAQS